MVDDPFYALDVAMDVFVNSGRDESSKVVLIGACAAVLEAAGYVCLKKHTEPPKEEGEYFFIDANTGELHPRCFVEDQFAYYREHGMHCHALGPYHHNALGPIKGDG